MSEHIYVPGMGNPNAKLFILGEAPSYEGTRAGKPFIGPSGRELDRLLADAGIRGSDCWISNVCKYMVPPNTDREKQHSVARAKSVGIDLDKQLEELRTEIDGINPNVILGL